MLSFKKVKKPVERKVIGKKLFELVMKGEKLNVSISFYNNFFVVNVFVFFDVFEIIKKTGLFQCLY